VTKRVSFTVVCDECGKESGEYVTLDSMKRYLERKGWTLGVMRDKCPDCSEKEKQR
jgi:hypothetical protein